MEEYFVQNRGNQVLKVSALEFSFQGVSGNVGSVLAEDALYMFCLKNLYRVLETKRRRYHFRVCFPVVHSSAMSPDMLHMFVLSTYVEFWRRSP